jgi:hypothetical protein
MFWKLAVSTLLLPAYLGLGAVAAKASTNTESSSQSAEYSAIQGEPQYYANRNYNQNDCDDNYRGSRSGGYYQNSYRPQRSYYRQNSYHQNSYHPQRHNRGYHNNSYHPQHHNNGHHNRGHNQGYGYQNNGYNH